MEGLYTPEALPAPIVFSTSQRKDNSKEHSNSTYLCISTNSDSVDINNFKIKSNYPNLNIQKQKTKNLLIFCVYSEGFFDTALKLFKSIYYFNIYYEFKNN